MFQEIDLYISTFPKLPYTKSLPKIACESMLCCCYKNSIKNRLMQFCGKTDIAYSLEGNV